MKSIRREKEPRIASRREELMSSFTAGIIFVTLGLVAHREAQKTINKCDAAASPIECTYNTGNEVMINEIAAGASGLLGAGSLLAFAGIAAPRRKEQTTNA